VFDDDVKGISVDRRLNDEASILIIDDDATNVALLDRLLRRAGYGNLFETTDPRLALGLFLSKRPDLVLVDLGMPHLDGFQLIAQLRSNGGEDVPILVVTADSSSESRARALRLGAQDLVAKPFDTTELLGRVTALLMPSDPHRGKDVTHG
jgi:putative two-component system response regulator